MWWGVGEPHHHINRFARQQPGLCPRRIFPFEATREPSFKTLLQRYEDRLIALMTSGLLEALAIDSGNSQPRALHLRKTNRLVERFVDTLVGVV